MTYDCVIVGGGAAGLQAAIQLGRYHHQVLVIDNQQGRSSLCKEYHNLLGWPEGVSGQYFREVGRKQAKSLGVTFVEEEALDVKKEEGGFSITTKENDKPYKTKRLLAATGIKDHIPNIPNIYPCLGKSIYLCPDCDGYEISNKKTVIIGDGNRGASLAKTLSYWTKELIYINHTKKEISSHYLEVLDQLQVPLYQESVIRLHTQEEDQLTGVILENGETIQTNHAFLAMEAEAQTDIFTSLHVERTETKHLIVNPRTKETNIPHVWAVGDITLHSQLLSVAIGDGAQAAIWIHKSLL